jgi:hypothetical protein
VSLETMRLAACRKRLIRVETGCRWISESDSGLDVCAGILHIIGREPAY